MSQSNKKSRWVLWLILGCVGLIAWAVIHQFTPPGNELDKLVYAMRETQRVGLGVHLARIAVFLAVLLFGWALIARVIHQSFRIEKEVVLAGKWRVVGWYLAFEAVLMVNFLG